jgi:uncharacterized protein (TIGR00270 family)
MAVCEMCGREGSLILTDVEGVELKVCPTCSKYGKVHKKPSYTPSSKSTTARPEWKVRSNFAQTIQEERTKRDMNHKQFASFLNERESVISKWESGNLKPRLDVARKLGKQLGISMTEKIESGEAYVSSSKKADEFTLGDIKIKTRKKH